ncbi:MAG: terminase [Alphaproteobacteria bacterium]|nr:terminase [Alphaproteobacteria bacterium]
MKYSPKDEQRLMTEIWDPAIADDPYAFVMFAFPWGKPGTPLEKFTNPRTWQCEYLQEMADHIKDQKAAEARGEKPKVWRHSTVSGRGPGKSALVAMRTLWFQSTRLGGTTIITANTELQLKSRTFAEVTKWHTMAINSHWFDTTVLSLKPVAWFEKLLKDQLKIDTGYYYAQGQLWSEENPDAFAGAHNMAGIQVVFDEASGIPKPIWNVTEGFFTEPVVHRYWDVFSNGRRNSGPFYDCFNDDAAFWRKKQIDSRTVEGTDTDNFNRMIEQYGADSDTVRVEVLGMFPKQGDRQFISNQLVVDAQQRELQPDPGAPLIMGIDIARFGGDETVFRWRQGRDGRSIPPFRLKDRDNMVVANAAAEWIDRTNPDAVNIDAGNGTGVIDRLKEMGYRVNEVWFGSTKGVDREWANKRTEMYAEVRNWLPGGCLTAGDNRLFRDLTAAEYDFFGKAKDQVMLESKESMRGRGLPSPDDGDAFALTFAVKVARRDNMTSRFRRRARQVDGLDYNLFG